MQLPKTEKSSWNSFYIRFASPLFAYLSRQVTNRQDAEDLLLEVFLRALRENLLEGWPEARQLAWLYRVARNQVIDYYRHQGHIIWLPLTQASELEDTYSTPEAYAEQQEAYRQLYRAMNYLSPAQQELLRLRYGQELHLTEIAEILDRSEGTVRKMLTRTLRQLRIHYEREGGKKA